MRRRQVLAALAGLVLLPAAAPVPARRIVALDWGLAETLIAIGAPPVGVPETRTYADWVISPALPPGTADVGLRVEPNLEILQQLAPDLILAIAEHETIRPLLERIAPVLSLPIYGPQGTPYTVAQAATRRLGAVTGRTAEAEALIFRAEETMVSARARLAASGNARPVVIASFLDGRHVRIYARHGLFDAVLQRIGLANAWHGPTNAWGFATVGLEALAGMPEARLVLLEPLPRETARTFRDSPLWNNLPMVRDGRVLRLPPVLMFGTLPAAMRFCTLLTDALTGEGGHG
ncbi:ABC transporter substrate-binding protein [Chelatococcus daeguensis]|uniref:ABC transporter substrate-binding protein n=1 Tax=Chelatococcus daeguensis TaxID=444444 RepID=UPI0009FA7A79|nr:ABC transporter substrate-binding protein [Chelatococcus daeguensis]